MCERALLMLWLRLHACLDKDETRRRKKGREKQRLLLAARRGTQRQNSDISRQARWADADEEGFSKQEWNPAQPTARRQVDRVRVAKPFEVLAGFLASAAAAHCLKGVRARRC